METQNELVGFKIETILNITNKEILSYDENLLDFFKYMTKNIGIYSLHP